jgi:hypothetical protein
MGRNDTTGVIRDRFLGTTRPLHGGNRLSAPVVSANGAYAFGLSTTPVVPGPTTSTLQLLAFPVTP